MAIAVMDVLRHELGLRVPENASVVGFDDVPQAAWSAYSLTTVVQGVEPMVEATVELLHEQMHNDAQPRNVVVPCRVIERNSVRPPPSPRPKGRKTTASKCPLERADHLPFRRHIHAPRIRPTLFAALALSALGSFPGAAGAEPAWPAMPIKYVVPFSPGGVSDGVARLVAQHLGERLGQPVIIDNRPGVSDIVGTQAVARAPADGYTLVGGTITTSASRSAYSACAWPTTI